MFSPNLSPDELKSFWTELLDLDRTLHATAQSRKQRAFLGHKATDYWGYMVPADAIADDYPYHPEDRRRGIVWEGRHKLGEIVVRGRLHIYQTMANPKDQWTETANAPGLETRYVYGHNTLGPSAAVVVARHGYEKMGEELTHEREEQRWSETRRLARDGLLDPTPADYEALLEEMRRGASGECRVVLPSS